MPSDSDLLFGKIAVGQGFCTSEQVEKCIQLQARSDRPLPLGQQLMNEGYLSADQHSEVLALQRAKLASPDPISKTSKESILFGKLAVREGNLTEAQLNECLRSQGGDGEVRALGEIMVSKGYLTPDQVKTLLSKQLKKIMSCPLCNLSYTVLTISQQSTIVCPRCKKPLQEGKPSASTRTDGEIATRTAKAIAEEAARLLPKERSPRRRVKTTCRICSNTLEGALDSTGRIRCPSCGSVFVARINPGS